MLSVGGAVRFGLFADQSRPAPDVRALTEDGRKIGGPEINKNSPPPDKMVPQSPNVESRVAYTYRVPYNTRVYKYNTFIVSRTALTRLIAVRGKKRGG